MITALAVVALRVIVPAAVTAADVPPAPRAEPAPGLRAPSVPDDAAPAAGAPASGSEVDSPSSATPAGTDAGALEGAAATASPWTIPEGGAQDGVFAAAQIFVGGDATWAATTPDTVLPAFRIDRAEVGGGARAGMLGALVRFETIRSAAPQSAFGIDGNSLLPRLKLAWGAMRPTFALGPVDLIVEARAGLVPEPWLETLEQRLGARGLLPLPSERAELLLPADLGASLTVQLPRAGLDVRIALTNGEGAKEVELDTAKNIGGLVAYTPWRFDLGGPLELGLQVGGRFGTTGIASVDDHRAHAAVFASHDRVHFVVEGSVGAGQDARAEVRPVAVGGVVDVIAIPRWLGFTARLDGRTADLAVIDSWRHDALLAVFSDLGLADSGVLRRTRLWCAVEGSLLMPGAGPVAGVPLAGQFVRGLVTLEVTGVTDVFDPRL
jgi:hypothetical protein